MHRSFVTERVYNSNGGLTPFGLSLRDGLEPDDFDPTPVIWVRTHSRLTCPHTGGGERITDGSVTMQMREGGAAPAARHPRKAVA